MPSKAELMATSLPAATAAKLGVDPASTATAAGTTQLTATTLSSSNFVNVTTSSIGAGVILADAFQRNFIWNSGPNTLLVYPPVGGTIMGLGLNAGLAVATGSGASIEGDGVTYFANISI